MNCTFPHCGCAEREQCKPEDAYQAALARAEAAEDNLNSGRELLREAWSQLNAIRAWRGAPPGVSEDWFSQLVDDLGDLLKDERLPWMTAAAKALVAPYQRQIEQAQDSAIEAERQRDEAIAASTARAEAMREACAAALEKRAVEIGRQECCGFGLSSPPECCADPLWMISSQDGAAAIRSLPIPAREGE